MVKIKKLNKKAEDDDEPSNYALVSVIIVVVVLIVLANVMLLIKKVQAEKQEEQLCKDGVLHQIQLLQMNSVAGGFSRDFVTSIDCPTHIVEIKDKGQTAIKTKVASEMRRCKNIWLGDANPDDELVEIFKEKDGTFCHVCSLISFKEKNIQVNGFAEYLNTENVPGTEKTYVEYLNGYKSQNYEEFLKDHPITKEQQAFDSFETSKDYGVLFVYAKGADTVGKTVDKILDSGRMKFATFGGGLVATGVATTVAAVIAGSGAGVVIGGVVVGVAGVATAYESIFHNTPTERVAGVAIIEYNETNLQDIGCEQSAIHKYTED